jgi:hypothetical protein
LFFYTAGARVAGPVRRQRWRSVAALLIAGLAPAGCRGRAPHLGAEAAIAERQAQGLRRLVAEAEKGPLISPGDVMVVVDERLVQDLLSAVLPLERVVGGRYRIRLSKASVRFEDGFALVRLGGRATVEGHDEGYASADLDVAGGLDVVDLDPRTGVLRGQVKIIGVDARRVAVMGLRAPREAQRLVEDLGRERLESFSELLSALEIPVRIEQEIALPAVTGEAGLRIGADVIRLRAAIKDVESFRGRLWVSIQASVEGARAR